MQVTVFKDKILHKSARYWNHFVFHPTDAIEDDWGQRILNQCAEDGVGETVRIYSMFEDIYTLNESGEIVADYTLNDYRIHYLLDKGFEVMIAYAFIPPWLSSDASKQSAVSKRKTRYKGKMIHTEKPKDPAVWGELCYRYTKHIIEEFGAETVSKMMVHCYNEPDIAPFFMPDNTHLERAAEYVKMYEAFEKAIIRAEMEENEVHPGTDFRMTMGGPALANRLDFLEYFMEWMEKGHHRMDYFAFHIYGTRPGYLNDGSKPLDAGNSVPKILELRECLKAHGYGDVPMVSDEWGAATRGFSNREDCPALMFRENEIFSCYFVKMLAIYDALNLPLSKLMICLSGQHEMTTDFSGFRNFFTLNFFKKPIYHAFKLSRRLGENVLKYEMTGTVPGHEETPGADLLTVFPTKTKDGRTAIFLAYGNPHFTTVPEEKALPDLPVTLKIPELKSSSATLTLIDRDHGNGYTEYLRLGENDSPSEAEIEAMRKASELRPETLRVKDEAVTFTLLNNSAALLEL